MAETQTFTTLMLRNLETEWRFNQTISDYMARKGYASAAKATIKIVEEYQGLQRDKNDLTQALTQLEIKNQALERTYNELVQLLLYQEQTKQQIETLINQAP